MGCTPNVASTSNYAPIKIPIYHQREAVSTLKLAPSNDLEITPSEINCLKIHIKQDYIEKWEVRNEMIKHFAIDISKTCLKIYDLYNNFQRVYSCFESEIHAGCIEGYNFLKGVEIFFIIIRLNRKSKDSIKQIKTVPYILVQTPQRNTTKRLFSAWADISEFLRLYTEKNELTDEIKSLKNYLRDYVLNKIKSQESASKTILKILHKYISLGQELASLITGQLQGLESLSWNLPKTLKAIDLKLATKKHLREANIVSFIHSL